MERVSRRRRNGHGREELSNRMSHGRDVTRSEGHTGGCHKGMKGGDHESHRVYGKEGIRLLLEGMEAVMFVKGRRAVYDGDVCCL